MTVEDLPENIILNIEHVTKYYFSDPELLLTATNSYHHMNTVTQ